MIHVQLLPGYSPNNEATVKMVLWCGHEGQPHLGVCLKSNLLVLCFIKQLSWAPRSPPSSPDFHLPKFTSLRIHKDFAVILSRVQGVGRQKKNRERNVISFSSSSFFSSSKTQASSAQFGSVDQERPEHLLTSLLS